jgi:glycosyltransferase involved in cell wall biosynthesis
MENDGKSHPWDTRSVTQPLRPIRGAKKLAERPVERISKVASNLQLKRALRSIKPDVINVHNIHVAQVAGWSVETVSICCETAPTVWTLHDMWSLTGSCAYSFHCELWKTGCGPSCDCPAEYPKMRSDRLRPEWDARKKLFERYPELMAVAPSRWLHSSALEGHWKNHDVSLIPYGLPLDTYRPEDRSEARRRLGLDPRGRVLAANAVTLNELRKGGALFAEAISHMRTRPLTIITLGMDTIQIDDPDVMVVPLGFVDDERFLATAYNAADLFVHPSLADNLPNVLLESIACGTPAVAFEVGGMPDIVRNGTTGWLVEDVSASGLARTLDVAVEDLDGGTDMRASCRSIAEAEYNESTQRDRYLELFRAHRAGQ